MKQDANRLPRRFGPVLGPKKNGAKQKPKFNDHRHVVMLTTVSLLTAFVSVVCVELFGENLPTQSLIDLRGTGRIEEIRLPEGSRKLEDIHRFVIGGGGGDDFGRIYINNYVINSSESPESLFYTAHNETKDIREKIMRYAMNRNMKMLGDRDVLARLHRGDNYIVQELENSIWASCGATISVEVNGTMLEHFPQQIPDNSYVETGVSNKILAEKFNKTDVGALADALCARRIYHFTVQ